MNVGSLFSGIGGIELGFEREGFKTKWFVEQDKFCQAVLKKHWPDTPCYSNIKKVDFTKIGNVDILTGGFPCQDISVAGKGAGIIKGQRSSLWKEYTRAIREIQPKYAVIENVSALTFRGLSNVLEDLAKIRYDAEWFCLRASQFGAPHKRERIYIVAYPTSNRPQRIMRQSGNKKNRTFKTFFACDPKRMGHVYKNWKVELSKSHVLRMVNGLPNRMDRTHAIGNAVVPQVAQFIARQIKEIERGEK